jgi:hypothetical protein
MHNAQLASHYESQCRKAQPQCCTSPVIANRRRRRGNPLLQTQESFSNKA